MNNIFRNTSRSAILVVVALLGACAAPPEPAPEPTPPKVEMPPPVVKQAPPPVVVEPPPPPQVPADQLALKEGVTLYNNGDYNGAIKRLNSANEIWSGSNKAIQLDAYKFMAFSYCVTARRFLCKQQFEKALKLDPDFQLTAGEKGHPLWGPVFEQAKKTKPKK